VEGVAGKRGDKPRDRLVLIIDLRELILTTLDDYGNKYNIRSFAQKICMSRQNLYLIMKDQSPQIDGTTILKIATTLDKDPREIWKVIPGE
jgi:DNA-binding phage protein